MLNLYRNFHESSGVGLGCCRFQRHFVKVVAETGTSLSRDIAAKGRKHEALSYRQVAKENLG